MTIEELKLKTLGEGDIVVIKETSPREGRGLDIGSASGGQGSLHYEVKYNS